MACFHHISRAQAEELLLKKGTEGSFLTRPSESNPSDYTLSVRLPNSDVTHVRIQQKGDFYDLYGGEEFATILELIYYYIDNPGTLREKNGTVINLVKPLHTEELAKERWYHRSLHGRDAEVLLHSKGTDGSYLVRGSTHSPGNYVLSVRVGDETSHIIIVKKDGQFYMEGGPTFSSLSEMIEFYKMNVIVEKSGREVHLRQAFCTTSFLPMYISQHVEELRKPNDELFGKSGFEEEYQQLQHEGSQHLQFTRKEASLPQNRPKNRFKNVLPFDHSRVVLQEPEANGNTYINANYVSGDPGSQSSYIATQGCLPATVHDFWLMIWQQHSPVIVMITNEVERGRIKCTKYWPDVGESGLYGKVRVTLLEENKMENYAVRYFLLDYAGGTQDSRCIYQFQYQSWPDHGVPPDPSGILKFMEDINSKAKECKKAETTRGPITVHCSAGIGRTGTYLMIDILIKLIEYQGWSTEIDIQRSIQSLRNYRSGMIQTEDQYRFVYYALQHFIENKTTYVNI